MSTQVEKKKLTEEQFTASSQPESFQARSDAFWRARQNLIEQLIKEGKLNPRATDLPRDLMLKLLEQFGLRGELSEVTEEEVKELQKQALKDIELNSLL